MIENTYYGKKYMYRVTLSSVTYNRCRICVYTYVGMFPDGQGLPAKKLEELANEASDQVYGKDSGPYECLR